MPHTSRKVKAIRNQPKKMIWESKIPMTKPVKYMFDGQELESEIFVGFSKGKTYNKSVNGPIGSSVKN